MGMSLSESQSMRMSLSMAKLNVIVSARQWPEHGRAWLSRNGYDNFEAAGLWICEAMQPDLQRRDVNCRRSRAGRRGGARAGCWRYLPRKKGPPALGIGHAGRAIGKKVVMKSQRALAARSARAG